MKDSVLFPLAISLTILAHHAYIHRDDERLHGFQRVFQIDDIRNHETWALFFFAIGATAAFV
jgi:hypothetical protein